jgi:DNA-binding transcriptional ArsR family regulator
VSTARVRLLDADPELGRWLSPEEVVLARQHSVVSVLSVPRGGWEPPPCETRPAHLGFLILDGLMARDELLAGATSTELLGPGELIQPWTQRPLDVLVPRHVTWTSLEAARVAVLGPSFTALTRRWPALRSALLERAMQRCSWLSTEHALCQISRVDLRLLVLFWHLAERWGRVTPDGMVVAMQLSHATLGHLVGAKRPTVTLALQRLASAELVHRRTDRRWVLHGTAADALARLDGAVAEPSADGSAPDALSAEAQETGLESNRVA